MMLANLITFETALKIPGAAATAPSVARIGRDNNKGGSRQNGVWPRAFTAPWDWRTAVVHGLLGGEHRRGVN